MEPRVKPFTAKILNVGCAELSVKGDTPELHDVIEFGNGLLAVVVDGDRIRRTVDVVLQNPDLITASREQ